MEETNKKYKGSVRDGGSWPEETKEGLMLPVVEGNLTEKELMQYLITIFYNKKVPKNQGGDGVKLYKTSLQMQMFDELVYEEAKKFLDNEAEKGPLKDGK